MAKSRISSGLETLIKAERQKKADGLTTWLLSAGRTLLLSGTVYTEEQKITSHVPAIHF